MDRLKQGSLVGSWKSMRTERKFLFGILTVSVLVRLIAAFYLGDTVVDLPGTYDQISYHRLAIRALNGHGFTFGTAWWPITPANQPTAHWSFLYTYYLIAVYRLFGVHPLVARVIQAILVGVIHPWLVFMIGKRVFGTGVGLVGAALTAVYAYFIYYSATLMTEPFYISAILACLYFAIALVEGITGDDHMNVQKNAWLYTLAIGVSLGATILLRQVFLFMGLFLMVWLIWALKKRAIIKVMAIGAILAVCILPFTIFNYARFQRFVLLNTNAGYAFFWANHPIYGTQFLPILPKELGNYQDLIPAELIHLDEAALDQALLKRGIQFVIDDPVRYFYLSLSRLPVYFMFWPSSGSQEISNISRLVSFGVMWPFMVAGLIMFFWDWKYYGLMRKHKQILLLIGFMVLYTGIHILSWALIRYRLPVDAVALLFAGVAIEKILVRTGVVKKFIRSKDEDLLYNTVHS